MYIYIYLLYLIILKHIVLYFKDQPTAWWMVSTATARIAKEARKASAEWRSADVQSTETKKEQVGRSLFRDMFWMSVCVCESFCETLDIFNWKKYDFFGNCNNITV